ncbi:hypothetical protein [Rhodococcus sp. B50]|uniref:hypothetical protein n=1 Tax=Rhodococcus sp. B50 TaxID=2682847 RepID=UPI001A035A3C|nr:hypothetical protein [Rhodococcus sp. B50]MBS9375442.1 hypothetical protein [Rhodococcus sp. B50]
MPRSWPVCEASYSHDPLAEAARKNDTPFVIGIYGGTTGVSLVLSVFLMGPPLTLSSALMWNTMNTLFAAAEIELPSAGGYVFRLIVFGALQRVHLLGERRGTSNEGQVASPPVFPPPGTMTPQSAVVDGYRPRRM